MTERKRSKGSQTFVWGVMGFLVLGMGGFGLSGAFLSSGGSAVASVDDVDVSVDRFFQAFQQDVQRASQNFGVQLTLAQAQGVGVDRVTLGRLLDIATIDNEAKNLQISVGDEAVREVLLQNEAFRGLSGEFDATNYDFALQSLGMSRDEYDMMVRNGVTQQIIRNAVAITGAKNDTISNIILDFSGERRSFEWVQITSESLPTAADTPTQAELISFYEANPEQFTQEETRDITYVALTPEMLSAGIEVSDDEIQTEYDFRSNQYQVKAGILADRLAFGNADDAAAALARLNTGEITFDELALERGLSLPEISLGMIGENDVSAAVRDVIFAADEPGIFGPVTSAVGPALFRVNSIRAASSTPLEDVADDIRNAIALDRAGNMVVDMFDDIDDLIAGGVSLEDIAAETEMQLFTVTLPDAEIEGLAADQAFVAEAAEAELDEERDIVESSDNGIFVLRVDAVNPEFVQPLAQTRDIAVNGYLAQRNQELVLEYAATLQSLIEGGADFGATMAANDLTANSTLNITRLTNANETPPTVSAAIFKLEASGLTIVDDINGAYLVKLNEITDFDPADPATAATLAGLESQISLSLESDIYAMFTRAIRNESNVVINQTLINAIIAQNSGG